jgi:pimeloyl-ACP methyl ester carboxylesterase
MLAILAVGSTTAVLYTAPGQVWDAANAAGAAAAGLDVRTDTIDGVEWAWLEGGEGPPLVMLHGFGADKYMWNRVFRALTAGHRVYAVDLPGFGDSSHADGLDYGWRAQAARIVGFLDARGLERVHLAGSSMGGHLAGLVATVAPERIESLMLLNAAGIRSPQDAEFKDVLLGGGPNPLIPTTAEEAQFLFDFTMSAPPWIPPPMLGEIARRRKARLAHEEAILADLVLRDTYLLHDRLDRLRAPTLVLWGADDRVLHPSAVLVLAGAIRDVRTVILDGVGHAPMFEAPGATAEAMVDFLKNLEAPPSG